MYNTRVIVPVIFSLNFINLMVIYSFLQNERPEKLPMKYTREYELRARSPHTELLDWSPSTAVPLVLVICDSNYSPNYTKTDSTVEYDFNRQIEQFRAMVGSLLYFSRSPKWKIYILTNALITFKQLTKSIEPWPEFQKSRLELKMFRTLVQKTVRDITSKYRPCGWQKLFLDSALPNEDSIIYMDNDIIFTGPVEHLWKKFSAMNSGQMLALGPEPWYLEPNQDYRPYAGKTGLNTGVMLMNLTRIRQKYGERFGNTILDEARLAKLPPRHDQDLVNQFLRKNKRIFFELTQKWNFLPSACTRFAPGCRECFNDGVTVVHGADASFYKKHDGKFAVTILPFAAL